MIIKNGIINHVRKRIRQLTSDDLQVKNLENST